MFNWGGPPEPEDLSHPDSAIRLASAVHRFQVPKLNKDRKISFARSFKTTGQHPKTRNVMLKADDHRQMLTAAIMAGKISHERVVLDAKRYQPYIHQILLSCKVQPEMARLDERLVFEWKSGVEEGNKSYKSEAIMYDLVMTIVSEGLGKAGVATEASLAGEFAAANREYAAAAGIFAFLADDHLPKWISRGFHTDDSEDLPVECHIGTAKGLQMLFQAAGQQMAVATVLIKKETPNYSLVAKLCLGIAEQLDEFVEHMRSEAFAQMKRMNSDFFTLVAFQSNLQRGLSLYFNARALCEVQREYGLAIAMLNEAVFSLRTRETATSGGLPDVSKITALRPLQKDVTDLRTHIGKLKKEWEKDNAAVYFEAVPPKVPEDKKLQQGVRIGKCEKYKLAHAEPVLLAVQDKKSKTPPPAFTRSDSDIARELQAKLDAGYDF